MKTCPFCAEEIQDQAVKCKHCGEFLESFPYQTSSPKPPPLARAIESRLPWFFRKAFIVIMFLSIGPLALPLVWWHPEMAAKTKTLITSIVLILTYGIYRITVFAYRLLLQQLEALQNLGI